MAASEDPSIPTPSVASHAISEGAFWQNKGKGHPGSGLAWLAACLGQRPFAFWVRDLSLRLFWERLDSLGEGLVFFLEGI